MAVLTSLTPDDLLTLPKPQDGKHYELSRGELIVVGNAGARHERVKRQILKLLFAYEAQNPIGPVFSESQFTLADGGARIPDVAFVGNAKLAGLPDADVAIPFAPDLAIEIISGSETAAGAESKIQEYLSSGVQEAWQIYPNERRVRVRTRDAIRDYAGNESLETPVLPGFHLRVSDLFNR